MLTDGPRASNVLLERVGVDIFLYEKKQGNPLRVLSQHKGKQNFRTPPLKENIGPCQFFIALKKDSFTRQMSF